MFKVKKIEEKIKLEDLEINSDKCKYEWQQTGKICRYDCCCDYAPVSGKCSPFKIKEY